MNRVAAAFPFGSKKVRKSCLAWWNAVIAPLDFDSA
jgi:hypothetical protein